MVPGVGGDLLMSAFIERYLTDHPVVEPGYAAWVRGFERLRRHARSALGPASSLRAMLDVSGRPLLQHLGFTLGQVSSHAWGHTGVLSSPAGPAAAYLGLAWGLSLDACWREALRAGVAEPASWLLVLNGPTLAIVDCRHLWRRRALEIDLDAACRDPRAAQVLWAMARADALAQRHGASRLSDLVRASDAHGVDVCSSLGRGVLDALGTLLSALDPAGRDRRRTPRPPASIFEQALTIVYRLLFLLFAEARGLVPTWHDVYREWYGLDSLCQRLLAGPGSPGTWDTLRAISRLAHRGCRTSDLAVTAFNGRLFSPARTPLAECRRVSDNHAARALLALATTSTRRGRHLIRFHDLGVEQLGAVYERVLEYAPVRRGAALTLEPTSTERKTSGSFYTPHALTDFLVRRTLAPLVDGRSAASMLDLRIVDPAMGSGAFLVAACRYLARRIEGAHVAEGTWAACEITERDRADVRRLVAERCLYGVDLNPTAVQLARLSLWLTTLAADRPLTFLDHHLASGNSLVGARLAELAHPPQPASSSRPLPAGQASLFDSLADELGREVIPERVRLSVDRSDTADAVRHKERRLARLEAGDGVLGRWLRAADLRCGLQLHPPGGLSGGLYAELQDHAAGRGTSLDACHLARLADDAMARARESAAFHWDLAFPEVFLDAGGRPAPAGGFDAVLGNPPWEMLRADTGGADERQAARAAARPLLQFVRRSGTYTWQRGGGHLNAYQLFVERALQLLRPGGRFGLILPSGIGSDVGSAHLRRGLLANSAIDTWFGFENRQAIFPIHRSMRFLVVAATRGAATTALPLVSGLREAAALDRLPDDPGVTDARHRPIVLTRSLLERWDAAHLTVPNLVSSFDLAILARALAIPALGSEDGWHVRFGRELNATDDSRHFVNAPANRPLRHRVGHRRQRLLPVVEGKHLRPFAVDVESAARMIHTSVAGTLVDAAVTFGRARVAYRDVASATNRLTLMAARLPAGAISTHTLYCARTAMPEDDQWCLVGLLNGLAANFLVRLQMSTHVTTALMARLPVPRPARGSTTHQAIAKLSRRLAAAGIDGSPDQYARLNAIVSRLYGLTREEHTHVVSTFPLLPAELRGLCTAAYERSIP
jgi:hypothetical protein